MNEDLKNSEITSTMLTQALAEDCFAIYYVDLNTGDFLEFNINTDEEKQVTRFEGTGFFDTHQKTTLMKVHEEDQSVFLEGFSREGILKKLEKTRMFMWVYRYMINGEYVWLSSKVTRMKGAPDHIIIGINNIDAQVRNQESVERERMEKGIYSMISAISGEYLCIFSIDPETDSYHKVSLSRREREFRYPEEGEDFFAIIRDTAAETVYPDDLNTFLTIFTRESVMREIRENDGFTLNYRITEDGSPKYVVLKGALAEEKDGPRLFFGIIDVDSQIRREQKYAYDLSVANIKANLDALTGVKNKHAYVDLEKQIDGKIDAGEPVSFAVVACDINNVKQVNDTRGHQAGDRYIREGCSMICNVFKHSPVFRIGGDEFVVVSQGMDYDSIDDLMLQMEEENRKSREAGGVIIACGMAKYSNQKNVSAVFEEADSIMYLNKRELKKTKE